MLEYILFAIGIFFLIKGADLLVDGSSSLAKKFGVPSLVIGLTIVAFGTSLPELVVNVFSAIGGKTDIALGNIIGSNIANILLILGISILVFPPKVKKSTTWKEIPFSLLAAVVLFIFSSSILAGNAASLNRVSGLVMLCFFAIFLYYIFEMMKNNKEKKIEKVTKSNLSITVSIILGLIGLYFGGKWVVDGVVALARTFGMSEFLISATIVAIGTSLPELVTGIMAAKKDADLTLGNVVGSNIFNIFFVLAITSIIAPILIPATIGFDILFLIFISILLIVFLFIGKHELKRWHGILFILLYVVYLFFIIHRG